MPDRGPPRPYGPRLWSIPDLARILGVTQQRIRYLVKQKRIPCIKVGRVTLFQPEDLRDFELLRPRGVHKPPGYTHAMREKRRLERKEPPESV